MIKKANKADCKANWYDCLLNFNNEKNKNSIFNSIEFNYKLEALRLNRSVKEALNTIKVGEYVDCRKKPTSYSSTVLNLSFNYKKQFVVSNYGAIIQRIA